MLIYKDACVSMRVCVYVYACETAPSLHREGAQLLLFPRQTELYRAISKNGVHECTEKSPLYYNYLIKLFFPT